MGRNSRWEGFSDGKEFPKGCILWWEGIPGVKDFLVERNSRCEGFPSGEEFPE